MWESYARTLEDHLRRTPSWGEWFEANKEVFSTALIEQVERTVEAIRLQKTGPGGRVTPEGPGGRALPPSTLVPASR